MSFLGLFGKKEKNAEPAKPKQRKMSALERLEEQRRLAAQKWDKSSFDKEMALRKIFPRRGVGGIGVRISKPSNNELNRNAGSVDSRGVATMDEADNGDSLRAQDRVERDAFYNPLAMYGMDEKVLMY